VRVCVCVCTMCKCVHMYVCMIVCPLVCIKLCTCLIHTYVVCGLSVCECVCLCVPIFNWRCVRMQWNLQYLQVCCHLILNITTSSDILVLFSVMFWFLVLITFLYLYFNFSNHCVYQIMTSPPISCSLGCFSELFTYVI
jgi:hypothetical protein